MRGIVKDIKALKENFKLNNLKLIKRSSQKSSTTDQQIYFVSVSEPEKRLHIQFVPENINVQRNTSTQSVKVVGRNNPLYQYTAGEKLLHLVLDFYAEDDNRQDIINKCLWLEALTYNDGYDKPPEKVQLVWGDLYKDEQWTVKYVEYTLSNFIKQAYIEDETTKERQVVVGSNFMPQQAIVNITLALDVSKDVVKSDLI